MKRHFILAILSLTAILLAGNVSYSQYRENNETFNIPVDTSGRYIFSVNTCPGEDCSTQMNVSFATDKNISECYVYLVSSRKRRSAGGYRLIPSELTLCTVYDSIYSKKANGENFYEDAVFHKFSCSFTNLKPDTRYDYWIVAAYKDSYQVQRYVSSKTHTFTTAGRKEWNACIISDYHSYPPLPKRLSSAMKMVETVNAFSVSKGHKGIDWVLHLGDVCAWGGSWSFWKDMYSQEAFRKYMWAGLNGNHDNMSRKYQLTNQYFKNATANPLNGYDGEEGVCYHFTYGNTLFVMLNSESMRDSTGLAKARQWVRKVLKESNAKFKVVCEHYQWFFGENGKSSQYRRWKDLFDECGVDLALGANNHIYVRSQKLYNDRIAENGPGTVYLQTPSSDNERGMEMKELTDNREILAKRWTEGGRTIGALLMEADRHSLTLTLLDRDGKVVDSVVISK